MGRERPLLCERASPVELYRERSSAFKKVRRSGWLLRVERLSYLVMRRALLASLSLLGCYLTGCCAHRFERPAGPLPTTTAALDAIAARRVAIPSFEFDTRLEFFGDGKRLKGKVGLLGRRPPTGEGAQLRFEALTPSDDTLALLITDGARFSSHERGAPDCLTGQACPRNVARLLPIDLYPDALYDALTGTPLAVAADATLSWDDCEGTLRLDGLRPGGAPGEDNPERVTLFLSPIDYSAIRTEIRRGEEVVLTLEYLDYATPNSSAPPLPTTIRVHGSTAELEIDVREAFLGEAIDANLFVPTCPAGTTPRELPCQ